MDLTHCNWENQENCELLAAFLGPRDLLTLGIAYQQGAESQWIDIKSVETNNFYEIRRIQTNQLICRQSNIGRNPNLLIYNEIYEEDEDKTPLNLIRRF